MGGLATRENVHFGEVEELQDSRIVRPWQTDMTPKHKLFIPWENRRWWADARIGRLVQHEQDFDHETRMPIGYRGTWDCDTAVSKLSYYDVDAIFRIAEETDCTLMEATIAHAGEHQLSQAWVQRALKGSRTRVKDSKLEMSKRQKDDAPVKFVDPRTVTSEANALPQPKALKDLSDQHRSCFAAVRQRGVNLEVLRQRSVALMQKQFDSLMPAELKQLTEAVIAENPIDPTV